ncbi:hypothetical protein BDF20DRAFT_842754 [Mycotypha africana]|uniref:uncharacterized protein n=1 Tax=Mycotypha africana TaxID=64632 RepID=UPI0023014C8D|nr:uncharacterized protein BDF20DRAFT_842754 [Mycotypha africana]KAI8991118.1 hypothetical protein BDF20DRAFT_842754 [Mycotypha africana]
MHRRQIPRFGVCVCVCVSIISMVTRLSRVFLQKKKLDTSSGIGFLFIVSIYHVNNMYIYIYIYKSI